MRVNAYKNVYVRFVQIQISRIVIYDLVKSGITLDEISSQESLNKSNLRFLLSQEYDYSKAGAYGFTSDELRGIRRESEYSYYYLFTGIMTEKEIKDSLDQYTWLRESWVIIYISQKSFSLQ